MEPARKGVLPWLLIAVSFVGAIAAAVITFMVDAALRECAQRHDVYECVYVVVPKETAEAMAAMDAMRKLEIRP